MSRQKNGWGYCCWRLAGNTETSTKFPVCKVRSDLSLNLYATLLERTNVRSFATAAGICCTDVLPNPRMNPCCAAFPR